MTRPLGERGTASTGWTSGIRRRDGARPSARGGPAGLDQRRAPPEHAPWTAPVTTVSGTGAPEGGALTITGPTVRSKPPPRMRRTVHVHV